MHTFQLLHSPRSRWRPPTAAAPQHYFKRSWDEAFRQHNHTTGIVKLNIYSVNGLCTCFYIQWESCQLQEAWLCNIIKLDCCVSPTQTWWRSEQTGISDDPLYHFLKLMDCDTFPSHSNHVQSAVHTADILPVSVLMIWGTQRPGACSIQCVLAWNSSTLVRWRTRAGSSVSFSCSVRAWRCRNRACLQDTHSHTSKLQKWIRVKSFLALMCFHYLSFFLSPFFSMNPQTSAQVSKLVTKSSMDCKHRKQIHLT